MFERSPSLTMPSIKCDLNRLDVLIKYVYPRL
nr:MAG TPA: hypothetical protein [Caudoviricetes sp.]